MTIAKKELTDTALRNLKPAPKGTRRIKWDAFVPGFGVRSTDKGRHTYVLVKRFNGAKHPSPREIAEVGEITLEAARATARQWNELIKAGRDPRVEQQRQREEGERARREAEERRHRDKAGTFAAAFESFVKHHLSTLRTGKDVEQIMRRVLIAKWGGRPLASIGRKDIITVVYELHDGGSPIGANRLLAYVKKFFRWALNRGLVDASPASHIDKPAAERKRDRGLSDREIVALWRASEEMGAFGRAVRLMLATAQRRNEVAAMRWSEIDEVGALWSLPRERVKADRGHSVPLSPLALGIVKAIPEQGEFVLTTTGQGPLRGWSKAKRKLDQAMLEQLRKLALERGERVENVSLPEWHLHDLRRSAATNMAKLGVDRIVIGRILNHAESGVTAIYDRHRRQPEVRLALNAWAAELERMLDERSADVVPMVRGRR